MATTEEEKPAEQAKEASVEKTEDAKPAMSEEEALAGVTERLQFFFSDANIRQDNFIRHKLMSDDKCVPIDDLLKFNTIKQYTLDSEVVKKAAEKLSDFLVVKDDAIARVKEFTKDLMDKNIPVTLVVSNLPTEEKEGRIKYTATNDELKEMFEGYGTVVLTKFRFGFAQSPDDDVMGSSPGKRRVRAPRVPIGSALVEFETTEAFDKAVADTLTTKQGATVEPKRKLKLGDNELAVVTLQEYIDSRKKRKPDRDDETEAEDLPTYKVDWKPGCVIKLDGLARACDREKMVEAIAEGLGKDVEGVKEMQIYVDFSRGQTDGCIRFLEPEQVPDILKKLQSGELHIAGEKVESAILLEGDAEKQYWQDFMDFKTKQLRQREEERRGRGGNRHKKKFRRSK